ncbi:MAG TPA: DUF1648 domain-containing protein [Methylomirabilota bacterium]|nr:DUF1648 domain-containing protein [Methylomirabilota bacterium]
MRAQRAVSLVLLVLVALQIAYFYPQLPETVASHFDAAGRPNGWAPKGAFLGLYAAVVGLMVGLFLIVPVLLARLPVALINLPNKDYWLAAERREQTWTTIQLHLLTLGNATVALVLIIFQLAIRANLSRSPSLSPVVWILLAAFLGFAVAWTVRFLRAFRLPPRA